MTNASTPATHMLSNGVLNPFNDTESIRINEKTGYLGVYDGVDIFLFNSTVKKFVYDALGLTASDTTEIALLDKIVCMIVYANATVRGIVGPTVEANVNTYYGGVYILPKLKMGVEVIAPDGIKILVDTAKFTTAEITAIKGDLQFTALDGATVKPTSAGFNTGTTN
jgi:hypothetical protein